MRETEARHLAGLFIGWLSTQMETPAEVPIVVVPLWRHSLAKAVNIANAVAAPFTVVFAVLVTDPIDRAFMRKVNASQRRRMVSVPRRFETSAPDDPALLAEVRMRLAEQDLIRRRAEQD